MGMKPPKGKALKIGGTVSSPKEVDQYTGVGNCNTKAKNVGVSNIGNSAMPKPKPSGTDKTF